MRAFTDLKRHELNDDELRHFANERVAQGTLAGVLSSAAFSEVPKGRPRTQFLTRRLWDVGNTGSVRPSRRPHHPHGGDPLPRGRGARLARGILRPAGPDQAAVLEFLRTLQILPAGEAGLTAQEGGR